MLHERTRLGVFPLTAALSALLVAAAVIACGASNGGAPAEVDAGPVPTFTAEDLRDSTKCGQCHTDHYKDWSASMHAYASDDPVFIAMNKRGQRETHGELGTFCVKCHAPMAVRDGLTKDGLNLAELDARERGVTCYFCHSITSVDGTHDAQLTLASDLVMRGPIADPVANRAHQAMSGGGIFESGNTDSAKACGACHDIVTPHGAAIERTFQEWTGSVYAQHGSAGLSCTSSSCHMNQPLAPRPISNEPANVRAREFHAHTFAAVDAPLIPNFPAQDTVAALAGQAAEQKALLDATLGKALCVTDQRGVGTYEYRVIVDNLSAGHDFPSGSSQDRRVWAEVVAYQKGQVIYSTGSVPPGKAVTETDDRDLWLIRDCMYSDPAMTQQVSMFWNAAAYESNTLPPPVTISPVDPRFYNTHVLQRFPRKGVAAVSPQPDRVTLQLHLQPIGLDVIDDLIATGDLDSTFRTKMPTLDVGPMLEWTTENSAANFFLDPDTRIKVFCVADGSLDPAAGTTPALKNAHCGP